MSFDERHRIPERCPSPVPDPAFPARDTASPAGDAAASPKFGIGPAAALLPY